MNHSSFWSPVLKQWRDWSTCYTRDWEHQDSSAWGTGNYGKIFILCENTWWESVKNTEPNISQWYPVNEQEARDTNQNKPKSPCRQKKKLFFFTTLRVAKYWHNFFSKLMESASLEIPRTQLDHSLDLPALTEQPALGRTGDNMVSRYSFPPWLSCDSVTSLLEFFCIPLFLKITYTVD